MTKQTPQTQYNADIKAGVLKPDPEQEKAVEALEFLFHQLDVSNTKKGWLSHLKLFSKQSNICGVYMYGGVGRGKSMLMDLFYDVIDFPHKRRVHFHEFMIEVHDAINTNDQQGDKLPALAAKIASQTKLLCFDEFHVTNVADAMILGRLFTALFELGVVVVATSNWPPDRLYEGGLQRERFLPFIELLKKHMKVIHLNSPTDYRREKLLGAKTYFYPLNAETSSDFEALYNDLTDHGEGHEEVLEVKGRKIHVDACGAVARFTFAQICEQPLGAQDYLTIAQNFRTICVTDIPVLTVERRNEAKRFILLIDAIYEARGHIIVTADAAPEELHQGKDHAFEFDRTISRLLEMQSKEYLKK